MPTMTDTTTPETSEALTRRLQGEFRHYVILHAKTSPERVVAFFLDESLGWSEATSRALCDVLRGARFWKASQVADVLLEAYAALQQAPEFIQVEFTAEDVDRTEEEVDTFFEEHFKVIPVGFVSEKAGEVKEVVLKHVETVVEMVDLTVTVLDGEDNPFAGLDPEQSFGAKDAAALMGRSYGYMKDHGDDLGGTKTARGAWQFTAGSLAAAWPTHKG